MWLIRTRYRFKKPQIGNYPAIDYASVEKKLSTFRQQSIQYIDSFIEN